MPLKYKFDVVEALKLNGYYPQRIRKERLFSESTMTKFRRGEPVSWENIETVCKLLHCQPGDLLEYVEDGDGIKENT